MHRISDTVLVLGLADLAVKRFPRIRDHLLIAGHSHHIAPRKPRLEAVQMDNLLRTGALAGTDQRVLLCLLVIETEAAHISRRGVAHWRFLDDIDAERLLQLAHPVVEMGGRV